MRSQLVFLVILSLWCIRPVAATPLEETPPPRFETTPCPFAVPAGYTLECGVLQVPENPANPAGPVIQLTVAIARSPSPHPAPDPAVFLHGGPAVPILYSLPDGLLAAFDPVLATRDVIFFDQRGAGYSRPLLDCPEFSEVAGQPVMGEARQAAMRQVVAACRDRLMEAGIDLAAYNTAASAADVEALRLALGYPHWNLIAGSYGTRLALEVMRADAPSLRSVLLDAPVPPQANLLENMPGDIQGGLDTLFLGCAQDSVCHLAYPRLDEVFYETVDTFNRQPVTLTLPSADRQPWVLSGHEFLEVVYTGLLSPRLIPDLPAMIYDVQAGQYARLLQVQSLLQSIGEHLALGAYLSTVCREEAPFNNPAAIRRAAEKVSPAVRDYFLDYRLFGYNLVDLCLLWPVEPGTALETQAVQSDVPTLLFSGGYDPLTPPAQARLTATTLPRSFLYSFPGLSHGVFFDPCPMTLLVDFLTDPTRAPEAACIRRMDTTPDFILRAEVARLPTQVLSGLLGLSLLIVSLRATALLRWRRAFTLRFSRRFVSGWPLLLGGALVVFFWTSNVMRDTPAMAPPRLLAAVLPLVAAVQAAFLFSPEDEPALEVTLAYPRPLTWLILERSVLLLAGYSGLALVGSGITAPLVGEPVMVSIARWLPPLVLLVAMALCVTLITRQAVFSVGLTALLWFGMWWAGEGLVRRWAYLWPITVYLQPDTLFNPSDFWLNRAFLLLLGLGLLALAVTYLVRSEEQILLGNVRAGRQARNVKGAFAAAAWLPRVVLPLPLAQLAAILFYEVLQQWRRRSLLIITLATLVLPVVGLFMARESVGELSRNWSGAAGGVLADLALKLVTANLLQMTWAPLVMILLVFLPPLVADTCVRDRQLGVREVLEALPVPPGRYLAGQLLGAWASVLAGLGVGLALIGVLWWGFVGPFDVDVYLRMGVFGAAGLAVCVTGLSVLLASGQPTRRRAVFVGAGLAGLSLAGLVAGLIEPRLWLFNPGQPALFGYFLFGWQGMNLALGKLVIPGWADVLKSLATGGVEVAVVWMVVWGWRKWQERKA